MAIQLPNLRQIIFLAGTAQIGLVLGSLTIPRMLKWRAELAKVNPLIRQMFWTYAGYILVINLCFGLVSMFCADDLLNDSTLAGVVSSLIAVYWISRILVQFLYFDRTAFPTGFWYKAGEILLVSLFTSLSIIYSWAALHNINH